MKDVVIVRADFVWKSLSSMICAHLLKTKEGWGRESQILWISSEMSVILCWSSVLFANPDQAMRTTV